MKLYDELAEWWPVFSDPREYRREAAHIVRILRKSTKPAPRTVLELGSGGGNSAFHLKAHFAMTLVDLSPQMLSVSRKLNPECRHIKGDIRTLRLGRTFDAVFVHDAICHMTTEPELRAVMQTAFEHCSPGGVALFVPDFVRETFVAGTDQGGSDSPERRLRFLQWAFDPDPTDTTYLVDFAILLRNQKGEARVVHDRHLQGLFPRARWLQLLRAVGFTAVVVKDDEVRDLFLWTSPDAVSEWGKAQEFVLTVGTTPFTSWWASETQSCDSPLTEVVRFEYHNDLKVKLLMVAITEATTR